MNKYSKYLNTNNYPKNPNMRLTLKTQHNDHNPPQNHHPLNPKNSKKIIIDRLYSKKVHNKSTYNPEDIVGVPASNLENRIAKRQCERKTSKNLMVQQQILLSSFKKQSCRMNSDDNQYMLTQPSSNDCDPKDKRLSENFNSFKRTDRVNMLTFSNSCTEQEQDSFTRIFNNLKIRYRPVNQPEGQKRVQRNLLNQLYALQTKQPLTNLVETAQFGVIKLERKSFDKSTTIDIKKQVSKDKQKNMELKIDAEPFLNKFDPTKDIYMEGYNTQTQPAQSTHHVYPNSNSIDILNRGQGSRRFKTEASMLYQDNQKICSKNDNVRQNGHIRAYSHNHRLLRAAPRSHTERACSYDREAGVIRRQSSKTDLFAEHVVVKNNSMPLHSYNNYSIKQHQKSREKLEQIRQQLHHIYNTRNTLNNQSYQPKNINSRSHCYLPHNSSNSSITSRNHVIQVQGRDRNQVKNNYSKMGGFVERGCASRAGNYGNNYNHRLLLERSKNMGARQ